MIDINILSGIFFIGFIVSSAGCVSENKFGKDIALTEPTSIGSILKYPSKFKDKNVLVKGQISVECPTGCWFYLKDSSGEIYIDLNASNFAIPQLENKEVAVEGTIITKQGHTFLLGKGVNVL
ncbi:MAG: hypothetical protein ABII27_06860 [bacterium]